MWANVSYFSFPAQNGLFARTLVNKDKKPTRGYKQLNQRAGWAWSVALFCFPRDTMVKCFSLQAANKANRSVKSSMKCISALLQSICLKMNMVWKSAYMRISVSKILVAGRKKTHKNPVRKCNLTGYRAVFLKSGLCISYQSPEDPFQGDRGSSGICGVFSLLPKVSL